MKVVNFLQRRQVAELLDTFFNPSVDSETNINDFIDNLSYYDYINEDEEENLKRMFNTIQVRIIDSIIEFDKIQLNKNIVK